MSLPKEKLFPLLAMFVLILSSSASLYAHANSSNQQIGTTSIIINDTTYDINTLFTEFPLITIETDDGNKTGISLSELLISTSITCPSCHHYTIQAGDNYQQTVSWSDIQQGILTKEKRTYFPHLAHAYWVRDIIEIEAV